MRMSKQIALLCLFLVSSCIISLPFGRGDPPITIAYKDASRKKDLSASTGLSHSNSFYVSPKISKRSHKGYLVQFKDSVRMSTVDNLIRKGIKVHSFHHVPFALLQGKLTRISTVLTHSTNVVGLFPNQICSIPKPRLSYDGHVEIRSQFSAKEINATYVWNQNYFGEGIKVAVVDTGISNHVALKGQVIKEKSFVLPKYGYEKAIKGTDDKVGHGTAVAGVIAGKGEAGKRGIAPQTKLLNAKVFPDEISGATDAGIIAAIEWTLENGVDIINLSLGRSPLKRWDPLEQVVNKATSRGVIVVAAAGNEGDLTGLNTMSIGSPGTASSVITVGASGFGNSIATFTSRGPSPDLAVKPDVLAPGVNIEVLSGEKGTSIASGTSFAAPHTAGAVALLWELCEDNFSKNTTVRLIKCALINTSIPLIHDELLEGAGEINVGRAFTRIQQSINTSLPITGIFPKKLPVSQPFGIATSSGFPYFQKLFVGSVHVFNFTLCTERTKNVTVKVSDNISEVLTLNDQTTITTEDPTTYWQMNFTVKNSTLGRYGGEILFYWGDCLLKKVPMTFTLTHSTGRMLFDYYHTSWAFSAKYGQYHSFYRLAEERNISVRHLLPNSPKLSSSFLQQFDMVFMPDTLSNYLAEDSTEDDRLKSISLTTAEKNALYNFTENGGLIIFISMSPGEEVNDNNREEVDGFLKKFNVKLGTKQIGQVNDEGEAEPVTVNVKESNIFGLGSPDELPFWGVNLVCLDWQSIPVLKLRPGIYDFTLGVFRRVGNGGIYISGSNFFFDNFAFAGKYGSFYDVRDFSRRLLAWAVVRRQFENNSTIASFQKGAKREFAFSYSGQDPLKNSNLSILDAIGLRSVEFTHTASNFRGSFPLRNGKDNYLLLSVNFGGWLLGRRFNVSVLPQEKRAPQILRVTPKNNTVKRFAFENTLSPLDVKLTVKDDESEILKDAIRSRILHSKGTEYQHSLTVSPINTTTSEIILTLAPEIMLEPLEYWSQQNEATFFIIVLVPDINLNTVFLTLEVIVRQSYDILTWMGITGLIVVLLVLILGVSMWAQKKRQDKQKEKEVWL